MKYAHIIGIIRPWQIFFIWTPMDPLHRQLFTTIHQQFAEVVNGY